MTAKTPMTPLLLLLLLSLAVRSALSSDFVEYYGLLGVDRDVATEDLKRVFRKRSVELHPDKNRSSDAVRQFQGLREAYECISDPASRRYYDAYGENWAEMKEYKEKHLKTTQQQMVRQGQRMYVKHVGESLSIFACVSLADCPNSSCVLTRTDTHNRKTIQRWTSRRCSGATPT